MLPLSSTQSSSSSEDNQSSEIDKNVNCDNLNQDESSWERDT